MLEEALAFPLSQVVPISRAMPEQPFSQITSELFEREYATAI